MRCSVNFLVPVMVMAACVAALAQTRTYKLGRTPSEEEIRAWDIAIGPEGKELPPGSGTAKEGAKIYAQRCPLCHGPTGEEERQLPSYGNSLVGGKERSSAIHEVRTIGNFWPFATTIWDYINRAMPANEPGSLKPDEVYALTAFLLFRNGIIQESAVIDAKSLPKIQMPNRNGFVPTRPGWKPGVPKRPFGQYP